MASKLECDRCGDQVLDDEGSRQNWISLVIHKVKAPMSIVKTWDLCPKCGNGIRHELSQPKEYK